MRDEGGTWTDNIEFGTMIVSDRSMSVDMVDEEIGDESIGGVDRRISQLKTTKLTDNIVRMSAGIEEIAIGENRIANITYQCSAVSCALEDVGDEGRGGGFAFGSRDCYGFACVVVEQNLCLTRDTILIGCKHIGMWRYTCSTDDDIVVSKVIGSLAIIMECNV